MFLLLVHTYLVLLDAVPMHIYIWHHQRPLDLYQRFSQSKLNFNIRHFLVGEKMRLFSILIALCKLVGVVLVCQMSSFLFTKFTS